MEKLLEIWISYDPDRKVSQSRNGMSPYGFAVEMAGLFNLSFRAHGSKREETSADRDSDHLVESNRTMKTAFGNAMLHLIKDRQTAARASTLTARPA